MDSELAKKQLVLAMLWSRYCHVRESSESQCEAKLLHDIAHVMGKMGSGKQQCPIFIRLLFIYLRSKCEED